MNKNKKENFRLAGEYRKFIEEKYKKEDDILYNIYVMNNMSIMDDNINWIINNNLVENERREMLKKEFTLYNSIFNIQ